jgi:hypothetical protein
MFQRDKVLPRWRGWRAFRRGQATDLHALGVDDETMQGIPRHSNVCLTMAAYVKSVSESQVSAMDGLAKNSEVATALQRMRKGR